MNPLLLYDTDDADFARDILDFLWVLDVPVKTIVHDANLGRTLHSKEQEAFDGADAVIFLLTPGSVRKGVIYPSQSVCDEMGRAKERFKREPWRIINIVDTGCRPQTIDQSAYIPFERCDHRSIVQALTALVRELRRVGVVHLNRARAGGRDMSKVAGKTTARVKQVCAFVVAQNYASIRSSVLHEYLRKLTKDPTEANLLWQELVRDGWLVAIPNTPFVRLSDVGFDLVRFERSRPKPPDLLTLFSNLPPSWRGTAG